MTRLTCIEWWSIVLPPGRAAAASCWTGLRASPLGAVANCSGWMHGEPMSHCTPAIGSRASPPSESWASVIGVRVPCSSGALALDRHASLTAAGVPLPGTQGDRAPRRLYRLEHPASGRIKPVRRAASPNSRALRVASDDPKPGRPRHRSLCDPWDRSRGQADGLPTQRAPANVAIDSIWFDSGRSVKSALTLLPGLVGQAHHGRCGKLVFA